MLTKHFPNEELHQGKGKHVILKATQLDPDKQYQTTLEMKEEIMEHLGISSWA